MYGSEKVKDVETKVKLLRVMCAAGRIAGEVRSTIPFVSLLAS